MTLTEIPFIYQVDHQSVEIYAFYQIISPSYGTPYSTSNDMQYLNWYKQSYVTSFVALEDTE